MANNRCKAKTSAGERCTLKASSSGFCHIHDPEKIARRAADRKAAKEVREKARAKGARLREVLGIILQTCRAKGWKALVSNIDEENWRYATISVSRTVTTGTFPIETVNGVFDITIDGGVQISRQQTSFHGYGLQDLFDSIMAELERLPWLKPPKKDTAFQVKQPNALAILEGVIKRFHIAARQLTQRHGNRATLTIEDEYDVQDFLHALLKAFFDDVRPEEYVPSHAGASSRIDFLLKGERIVVEAKMTNDKLKDKQIGEQLIIDIKRYQSHPDCNMLVCIVYDPSHNISNPVALEKDLSRKHDNLEVRVFVVPH
jgi:hypothetical protein